MKEVQFGYALSQKKELRSLIEKRMEQLEEVVASFAPDVSAEWDCGEGSDVHQVVTLRLTDWAGSVIAVFDPKELESPSHAREHFNMLWRNLLAVRSHKLLERLTGTGSGVGGS